jgi:hypothetical protein
VHFFIFHSPPFADKAKYRFLGCYQDNSGRRDLPYYMGTDNKLTTEKCGDKCKAKGYPYFGTQYYYYCYCGKDYGAYGKVDVSQCNTHCYGNKAQFCGGSSKNSVYSTGIAGEMHTIAFSAHATHVTCSLTAVKVNLFHSETVN